MRRFILAIAACLATGLGAGGARAQEDGGWFDEEPARPQLRIQGEGPYDPPPPDFRSDRPRQNSEREETTQQDDAAAEEREDDREAHERALSEFSPHLSPYGYWVRDPVYGRVWVPTRSVVGPEFSPYVTGGHWELTADDEWLWVSDYPFGWITFHYGRWVWTSGPGWVWVPGYRYAPAWVDFRIGASGYIGWGPLPAYYVWHDGVFISVGVRRPLPFIFCPTTYVFSHSVHRHVIRDRYRVRSIAADTWRYRPHRTGSISRYVRGPSPAEARIPRRALPERRTIARPRITESFERRRQDGAAARGQASVRRDAGPVADQRSMSSARRAERRERSSTWSDVDSAARSRSAAQRAERAPRSQSRALPDLSSTRRATPSRAREARPRQWFDDSSPARPRAAPSRPAPRDFNQAQRGSMNLARPKTPAAPQQRWRAIETPKDGTLRVPERSSDRERSYEPLTRPSDTDRSYRPATRSKGRSSRGAVAPRTQHRIERENRGTRR